jgi:hypothetical protein
MNVNNINPMTIYNNIHYEPLTPQPPFDSYPRQRLSKPRTKKNTLNANVNKSFFPSYIKINFFLFIRQ